MQLELTWVISGICAFVLILLSAIWNELKKLNEKITDILINNSEQKIRISSLEKLCESLPCASKKSCSN